MGIETQKGMKMDLRKDNEEVRKIEARTYLARKSESEVMDLEQKTNNEKCC